jgi:hypothetical protein
MTRDTPDTPKTGEVVVCDRCHAKAQQNDKACWNCGSTVFEIVEDTPKTDSLDNQIYALIGKYELDWKKPGFYDALTELIAQREQAAELRGAKPYIKLLEVIAETMEEDRIMLRTAKNIREALVSLSASNTERNVS